MIEVNSLSKKYGKHLAVSDVSFSIGKGEIVGFLGPNGAGKSTIMNILTGYISATSGSVTIDSFDILEQSEQAKRRIGYLPEIPPLYLDMTVTEYLNFVYDLKKVRFPRNAHIEEILRLVKIDNVAKRLIKNLSKGYRQRVGIASALVGNPDVLILDEPTVGLDPKQIIEIRELIAKLGKNHTIILSSHILSEIQAVCKRILIINGGKLIADDTAENLSNSLSTDHSLLVRVAGVESDILKILTSVKDVESVVPQGMREQNAYEFIITPKEGADIRRDVFTRLAERGKPILELRSNALTLEQIFLRLTDATATVALPKNTEAVEEGAGFATLGEADEVTEKEDEE